MKSLLRMVAKLSTSMDGVGGVILVVMMLLTVIDVVLRVWGRPITGTYELVAVSGAMVIGFAIPQTTRENAHIAVDILIYGQSKLFKDVFFVGTKLLGVVLFLVLAYFLYKKGNHLLAQGDVSQTLQIPAYPVAYVMAFCFFVESVVLLFEIPRRFYREGNHG